MSELGYQLLGNSNKLGNRKVVGGNSTVLYIADIDVFTAIGKAEDLVAVALVATVVADAAALAALPSPSAGDYAYQTDIKQYFKYTTEWVAINGRTVLDTHTFAGSDGFKKVVGSLGKQGATGAGSEEPDVHGEEIKFEFYLPGDYNDILFAGDNLNMMNCIVLIKEPVTGRYFQLGTEDWPAKVTKTEFGTGMKPNEPRGYKYTITAYNYDQYISSTITLAS